MILQIKYIDGVTTYTQVAHVTVGEDSTLIYKDPSDGNEQQIIDKEGTDVYRTDRGPVSVYSVLNDSGDVVLMEETFDYG